MRKLLTPFALVLAVATTMVAQSNIQFLTTTGRQPYEIKADYPYDIPIRNSANDTLNTADIFVKNDQPTVLLFWLTTCAPCRLELAAVAKKYEQWQQERPFNLYAISIDWPRNEEQFVTRVQQGNWPFPAYHDFNRDFGKIMPGNLNGLPQVFILNKEGEIVHHKKKYRPGDEDQLFDWIKAL